MSAEAILTSGYQRLKRCRCGYMLYNPNDLYIGRSLDLYGEFSEGEVDLFRQVVRPASVVLDVGANIGAHTLFFAQAVGSRGLVLAFEPQRILFQTLCANLALNAISNVLCLQVAVGSATSGIQVPSLDYGQPANFGGLSLEHDQAGAGEEVSVRTLDSLQLPACSFIKIDVEGMELEVLKGAVDTIRRYQPILYVENDRRERSPTLISFLRSLGYRLYWHLPPLYNPNNFFGCSHDVFPTAVSCNMLCLHQSLSVNLQGFREVAGPEDWVLSGNDPRVATAVTPVRAGPRTQPRSTVSDRP